MQVLQKSNSLILKLNISLPKPNSLRLEGLTTIYWLYSLYYKGFYNKTEYWIIYPKLYLLGYQGCTRTSQIIIIPSNPPNPSIIYKVDSISALNNTMTAGL